MKKKMLFRIKTAAALSLLLPITMLPLPAMAGPDDPCRTSQPGVLPLVVVGAMMGVVDFTAGTAIHEGSHAVAVAAFGGKITDFVIIPGRRENGQFNFGYTEFKGKFTPTQYGVINMAPKMTDAILMGGYALLLETGSLPKNKWGQLTLAVIATGAWVDFSKDLFSTNPYNDTVKTYSLLGAQSEMERLPFRLIHGALAVGGAIEIGRGWYRLFKNEDAGKVKGGDEMTPLGSPVVGASYVGWKGSF